MIIRINPIESTIEIFYKNYVHLHGFLKLYAEDHSKNKHYTIIVQILSEQTISDYIFTRQKLRNVQITDYIKAELESELQYVIQGRPILCIEKDGNTKEVKSHVTNVFFLIEDLMENKTLQPHLMKISEDQSDIHEDLRSIFPPDGLFMGNLASEKKVEVYFPFKYLMYHFFIAGATGMGKSNLNQVIVDGLLQHNTQIILGEKGTKISMLAIDMHDEYALGCIKYGVIDICKASGYNKELFGSWFYLYPNKGIPPAELKSLAEPCLVNYQEITPEDLFATGSFNDLQAGAIYSAYRSDQENYIENLLSDGYRPPGGHDEKTMAAIRRRMHWLEYSDMFQSNAVSKLPEIVLKLEKGNVIIFNASMISDLEQFLFNSILARTLFDIRKSLKSSSDLATLEKKLKMNLPKNFYENYKTNLKNIYIKTGTTVKDPSELPIIIFTIEEAPSILRPEMMRHTNVFKDISRQGRKFNLGLEVISQQYSPIDNSILSNMNTVINLPLRSEQEKTIAAKMLGGGIQHSDLESLTGTRGIALISGIWLTNFQKLKIPLYDEYFEQHSKRFYENFAKKVASLGISPPHTSLP
ncbi:MAG: ATP-binding protein [Candidatus Lokiarchaeota archaeon]|nr:ATP-binding protein [Candidatus Lokiarchaeota archaeon]